MCVKMVWKCAFTVVHMSIGQDIFHRSSETLPQFIERLSVLEQTLCLLSDVVLFHVIVLLFIYHDPKHRQDGTILERQCEGLL